MNNLSNEELISYRDDCVAFMDLYQTDEQKEGLRIAHDELLSRLTAGQRAIEAMEKIIIAMEKMDCGDSSCLFAKDKKGMRTNGGCRCIRSLPTGLRIQLERIYQQRPEIKR